MEDKLATQLGSCMPASLNSIPWQPHNQDTLCNFNKETPNSKGKQGTTGYLEICIYPNSDAHRIRGESRRMVQFQGPFLD